MNLQVARSGACWVKTDMAIPAPSMMTERVVRRGRTRGYVGLTAAMQHGASGLNENTSPESV